MSRRHTVFAVSLLWLVSWMLLAVSPVFAQTALPPSPPGDPRTMKFDPVTFTVPEVERVDVFHRHGAVAVAERVGQQRRDHLGHSAGTDVRAEPVFTGDVELPAHSPESRLPLADLLGDDVVDARQLRRARR